MPPPPIYRPLYETPPSLPRSRLQVENLLLSTEGAIKLCDFGSATTKQTHPDHSWTAVQRGLADDEVCVCVCVCDPLLSE